MLESMVLQLLRITFGYIRVLIHYFLKTPKFDHVIPIFKPQYLRIEISYRKSNCRFGLLGLVIYRLIYLDIVQKMVDGPLYIYFMSCPSSSSACKASEVCTSLRVDVYRSYGTIFFSLRSRAQLLFFSHFRAQLLFFHRF